MARFRILVLLLVLAALATGRQFGPDPQYNAFLTLVPMLVLGYFVARPETYNPDVPFYESSALDGVRKWARWMTLAGLVLFLGGALVQTQLFVTMDSNPAFPSGPDPLAVAGSSAGTIGMGLLCIGFVAWSAAVFLKKK